MASIWTKTVATVALLTAAGAVTAQPAWVLTELPDLPGFGDESWAQDINNLGQVVGRASTRTSGARAVLWQQGQVVDLGSLRSAPGGWNDARAINDAGQVVGMSDTSTSSSYRAFLWQAGSMTGLTMPPPFDYSGANAINGSGTIAGFVGTGLPAVWRQGVPTVAPVPPDFLAGVATGINDAGRVIANSDVGGAFVWQGDSFTRLAEVGEANAINQAGQIAGWSGVGGAQRAVLWDDGGAMRDLGVPDSFAGSVALGLNDMGQVVGRAHRTNPQTGMSEYHAVLWQDGKTIDLNTLPGVAGSGLTLAWAEDVNDHGQIVGEGIDARGRWNAFLLSPVPEPSAWALLLVGAGLVVPVRRRSRRSRPLQRCSRR